MSRRHRRSPKRYNKATVHVLMVELKHGNWVRVFATRQALDTALAEYVRDEWTSSLERDRQYHQAMADRGVDITPYGISDQIPRNNAEMIRQYVELSDGDFSYATDEVEIET